MPEQPRWRRYLRFWRSNVAADVDEEFQFHVQERIDELTARGVAPGIAREEAIRRSARTPIRRGASSSRGRRWSIVVGAMAAAWATKVLDEMLFQVDARDPIAFTAVPRCCYSWR